MKFELEDKEESHKLHSLRNPHRSLDRNKNSRTKDMSTNEDMMSSQKSLIKPVNPSVEVTETRQRSFD